ncbi:MAG: NAD(P)/FAD-dependent oxidoreductase [Egibacteraceae bacterium]
MVIVGGGFGGLACARELDGRPVDVLLVDSRNYHLFTPLLYQVATALLNPSDIAYPLRACFRGSPNVKFRQALVTGVAFDVKTIQTDAGDEVAYDYLVLATGSVENYFGSGDLEVFTFGLKTLEQALRLRNHVLACLERACQTRDDAERKRLLTFVVVGGGPTGVEYAGALVELLKLVLGHDYPDLSPGLARIVLVEGLDRLLAAFPERLGRYAEDTLRRRGVQVRTGALVAKATDRSALLGDGEEIQTATVVWSAGVRPNEPMEVPEPARSRSRRIEVDAHLRVAGRPDAFAIGDVASMRHGDDELPMLSAPAMQAGRHVAHLIMDAAGLTSGSTRSPRKPFRYRDKGTMATIGRNAAVGQIGPLEFTGFVGWAAWLTVHLYYLVGFRNRLAVFASWGWNYLRKDRPLRIIVQANGRLGDRETDGS